MDSKSVNNLIVEAMLQENKKETIFQICSLSTFLLFLFIWEPVSMYFLFFAIQSGDAGWIIMASLISGGFLACFALVQYINNTYADCNSWKIITKIREHFLLKYYVSRYYTIHNKFSMGEIFDRIYNSGMGIIDYVFNYVGIGVFALLGAGYSIYYLIKAPTVLLPIFALICLELFLTKILSKKMGVVEEEKRQCESKRAETGETLLQDLEFSMMYKVEDVMLEQYLDTLKASWNQEKKKRSLAEGLQSLHSFTRLFSQIILERGMISSKYKNKLNAADTPTMLLVLDKLMASVKEVIQRLMEISQKKISVKRILDLDNTSVSASNIENPKRSEDPIISIENISVELNGYEILKDISLAIEQGEKVAIIGENGSGKSTLLKAILGLVPFSGGHCCINGVDIRHGLDKIREGLAYIPVQPFLFSESVVNNVEMGTEVADTALAESAMVFCREFMDGQVESLSGGQQQLVNICRGIVRSAGVLFADEPTSHLKKEKSLEAMKWILGSCDTCVVITHDVSLLPLFTKVMRIDKGKILPL